MKEGKEGNGLDFLLLFLSLAGCAVEDLLNIVVDGSQLFIFFLGGVVLVIKFILFLNQPFNIRL